MDILHYYSRKFEEAWEIQQAELLLEKKTVLNKMASFFNKYLAAPLIVFAGTTYYYKHHELPKTKQELEQAIEYYQNLSQDKKEEIQARVEVIRDKIEDQTPEQAPDVPEEPEQAPDVPEEPEAQTSDELDEILFRDLPKHEGYEETVYRDTEGNRTIGVGFNLERNDAPEIINSLGANYQRVLRGAESLSKDQIEELLKINIQEAKESAKRVFENYEQFPVEAKAIAINLIFNMGAEGVRGFPNFIRAMNRGDWDEAAEQLMYKVSERHGQYSDWWKQVTNNHGDLEQVRQINPHNRAVEIITTLRNL